MMPGGHAFGPRVPRSSWLAIFVCVVLLAAVWQQRGASIVSPGPLTPGDSTPETFGGVTSHAALERQCGACHVAPWSTTTMTAQCRTCHTDIHAEERDSSSLHAAFAARTSCLACHDEHRGGATTRASLDGLASQHNRFGFPLDGAHATVTCAECHTSTTGRLSFAKTPTTCVGCHQPDDKHNGTLGNDCAACHTTVSWEGAQIQHDMFPLDHGSRRPVACKTCHTDPANYKSYTCYGCHAHDPARVARQHRGEVRTANLDDCIQCHAGGREHGERGEHGER